MNTLLNHCDRRRARYPCGRFVQGRSDSTSLRLTVTCIEDQIAGLTQRPRAPRLQIRAELFEYIEVFYNRQRLHSALEYDSPAAYEKKHQVA